MPRSYRLTENKQFERVRREGRSWVGRYAILYAAPNGMEQTRAGFSVSKRVGKAVRRNRAKRLMREALRQLYRALVPGWDLVFSARTQASQGDYRSIAEGIVSLLKRAGLLQVDLLPNEKKGVPPHETRNVVLNTDLPTVYLAPFPALLPFFPFMLSLSL
ncbi:MAG: ribonuclease P protein component [Chloroflexi bacterium]|nr:ribonuclease P protein component [Chloroflexota bacterium]